MNTTASEISLNTAALEKKASAVRPVLVIALLAAAIALVHLTPVRALLSDARRLREAMLALGIWVYPVSVVIVAILLACGVPRLPIHAAGGLIFGFGIGVSLTLLGAILGHYLVFLLVRWGGRDWVLSRWPRLHGVADAIHQQGIVGVLLARQLPAHAMIINACLALSHVKHRDFVIGSALGLIPEAIPAALVGAGLVKTSFKESAGFLALAAASFAILWIAAGFFLRSIRNSTAS